MSCPDVRVGRQPKRTGPTELRSGQASEEVVLAVTVSATPNPMAMKFTVGHPVGEARTFATGSDTDDPVAAGLLAIGGVASVFMTADFVTITKQPSGDWEEIVPAASSVLAQTYP